MDGLIGRRTWQALFGPATVGGKTDPDGPAAGSLAATVLRVAAGECGVREDPSGSNSGPEVDGYLASLGLPPGKSWCAAFLYWCFDEAARRRHVANPLPRTGCVLELWAAAQSAHAGIVGATAVKDPRLVTPGMVFCLDCGRGRGHAGLVAGLADGRLVTIEGNTGTGVCRQTARTLADINLGFIKAA